MLAWSVQAVVAVQLPWVFALWGAFHFHGNAWCKLNYVETSVIRNVCCVYILLKCGRAVLINWILVWCTQKDWECAELCSWVAVAHPNLSFCLCHSWLWNSRWNSWRVAVVYCSWHRSWWTSYMAYPICSGSTLLAWIACHVCSKLHQHTTHYPYPSPPSYTDPNMQHTCTLYMYSAVFTCTCIIYVMYTPIPHHYGNSQCVQYIIAMVTASCS